MMTYSKSPILKKMTLKSTYNQKLELSSKEEGSNVTNSRSAIKFKRKLLWYLKNYLLISKKMTLKSLFHLKNTLIIAKGITLMIQNFLQLSINKMLNVPNSEISLNSEISPFNFKIFSKFQKNDLESFLARKENLKFLRELFLSPILQNNSQVIRNMTLKSPYNFQITTKFTEKIILVCPTNQNYFPVPNKNYHSSSYGKFP